MKSISEIKRDREARAITSFARRRQQLLNSISKIDPTSQEGRLKIMGLEACLGIEWEKV